MGKIGSVNPMFSSLTYENKLKTILCPKTTSEVKIVNKYIRIMCLARDNLSEGLENLNYPTMPVNIVRDFFDYDNFSDVDEWEDSFSSTNSEI